jgi:hypothetical protein
VPVKIKKFQTVPNETKNRFFQMIEKIDNLNEKLISLRFWLKSSIKGHLSIIKGYCVLSEMPDMIESDVI